MKSMPRATNYWQGRSDLTGIDWQRGQLSGHPESAAIGKENGHQNDDSPSQLETGEHLSQKDPGGHRCYDGDAVDEYRSSPGRNSGKGIIVEQES